MNRALITGITGQDGAYLSKFLLEKNYDVYGITRNHTDPNKFKNLAYLGIEDRIHLIPGNLLSPSNIISILETIQPAEVYNLASQSSVGLSFEQPRETMEFNILSTVNLLEAIKTLKLPARFYQASSSEMYGRVGGHLPVVENSPMYPVSPYGISKMAAHCITVNYRETYGLYCCSGILFNHESVLRAEHFVTKKIISTAVKIKKGMEQKLRLGNIEIKRDFGYAPEYVKAMWLMLQQERPDDYIIATGEAHSLREFVKLSFSYLDLEWENYVIIDKKLYRPLDLDITYGDPTKAKQKLGWKYQISFEELVRLLVEEEVNAN